jgi:hypothetical protein
MNSLFVAALLFLAAPDPTHEQSSTLNNAANRAEAPKDVDEDAQMAKVPGGKATPKKQWKKGDARGKPQKPKAKKYKVPPKAEEGAK